MHSFKKTVYAVFIFGVFFVSKGPVLQIKFYFTKSAVKCSVAVVKRLAIFQLSAEIFSDRLGHCAHFLYTVNRIQLSLLFFLLF